MNSRHVQHKIPEVFLVDAREIVSALIDELTNKRESLVQRIGDELARITAGSEDEAYRHFWRVWLMLNGGEELQEVDRKLAYQHRLQRDIDGKPAPHGTLTDELIEAARGVPITDIVGEPARGCVCICPLHDDSRPSMRIYTEQNRAWCYVCNDGGDPIKLRMLMTGSDFQGAVRELAGGVA